MSLLYSILKPIVRKVVKGSSIHQEKSYEEFKQASYNVQKKFKFALPKINGFEFRDEPSGRKQERTPTRPLSTSPAAVQGAGSCPIKAL